MKTLRLTFLALIGGFTGGCSLYFLTMPRQRTDTFTLSDVLTFAIPGLLITVGCAAAIIAQWRR